MLLFPVTGLLPTLVAGGKGHAGWLERKGPAGDESVHPYMQLERKRDGSQKQLWVLFLGKKRINHGRESFSFELSFKFLNFT